METVIEEIAEPKKGDERIEHCPKHGEFAATFHGGFRGLEIRKWTPCTECETEYRAAVDAVSKRRQRRENARLQLVNSGVPSRLRRKSLDNFIPETDDQRAAHAYAVSYVQDFPEYLAEGRCLGFIGPVGVGKSHLACAILLALAEQCYEVRYITASDLIYAIRETWHRQSDETCEQVLKQFCSCRLLLIDDVGCLTAEHEHIRHVIERRYNDRLPTMITSNLNTEKLTEYIDVRGLDRLRENGGRVFALSGSSRRAKPESTTVNEPLWWERSLKRSPYEQAQAQLEDDCMDEVKIRDYPGLYYDPADVNAGSLRTMLQ